MKVVIIGPGALGCLLASTLSLKHNSDNPPDIWILDHRPDRVEQLAKNGLILEEEGRQIRCRINAAVDPRAIGTADVIFLCVKSQNVADGLTAAREITTDDTLLITLQNGIGHLETLQKKQEPPVIALGVTAQGANLVGTGHVRHAGNGITRLGLLNNNRQIGPLKEITGLMNNVGFETHLVDNIIDFVWAKLLVNVGINALTAICNCPNGGLLESDATISQLTDAVREAETIARARGIQILADPVAVTLEVCKQTGQNISSMLQDVRHGRPTEIDSINGAIIKAARELHIPVPVNEELVSKVKSIEKNYPVE